MTSSGATVEENAKNRCRPTGTHQSITRVISTLRAAAIKKLEEKEKTISEKASKFNQASFEYEADFERDQKAIKALKELARTDVLATLKNTLDKDTRRMRTVLGFAKEHKAEREVTPSFEDLDAWKKTRVYQR